VLLTVPNPARRRLQRPRHRGDPAARRAGLRMALTRLSLRRTYFYAGMLPPLRGGAEIFYNGRYTLGGQSRFVVDPSCAAALRLLKSRPSSNG
jgi:hypothetical protein